MCVIRQTVCGSGFSCVWVLKSNIPTGVNSLRVRATITKNKVRHVQLAFQL